MTGDGDERSPLYVYGVVSADGAVPGSARVVEPSGGWLTTVVSGPVAGLVSPLTELAARPTRANLEAHQGVVEEAASLGTIIPMRFGVVVDDTASLVGDLLRPRRTSLVRLLAEYAGRVEMRVEACYREEVAVREAIAAVPRIRKLHAKIDARPAGATYYDRLNLGQLVATAIEQNTEREATRLGTQLAATAERARRLANGDGGVVFRGAFLLDKTKASRFDTELARIAEQEADRMTFRVVGPLAPWDFVDLPSAGPVREQRRERRNRRPVPNSS